MARCLEPMGISPRETRDKKVGMRSWIRIKPASLEDLVPLSGRADERSETSAGGTCEWSVASAATGVRGRPIGSRIGISQARYEPRESRGSGAAALDAGASCTSDERMTCHARSPRIVALVALVTLVAEAACSEESTTPAASPSPSPAPTPPVDSSAPATKPGGGIVRISIAEEVTLGASVAFWDGTSGSKVAPGGRYDCTETREGACVFSECNAGGAAKKRPTAGTITVAGRGKADRAPSQKDVCPTRAAPPESAQAARLPSISADALLALFAEVPAGATGARS